MNAMTHKNVPEYLINVISSYLHNRQITYTNRNQEFIKCNVNRGVPQGSVLGPLLWNIAFNEILRTELPEQCQVLVYADDTLVAVKRDNIAEAVSCVELASAMLAMEIRRIGLTIAANKTEVTVFVPRRVLRPFPVMTIQGELVKVMDTMKYLGLYLDSRWTHGLSPIIFADLQLK